MTTFIYGLIFFILCLLPIKGDEVKLKKWATLIVFLLILYQLGFRDWRLMANDTGNYYHSYNSLLTKSWTELFDSFNLFTTEYSERDPGFSIFVKATQLISYDFEFFLIIVALCISTPVCYLLYKFVPTSSGIFFGALIFESLFAPFFMTGLRQTVAMGIIYASVPFIFSGRLKKHYIFLLVAYTIHSTALVFAPVALMMKYCRNPRILLIFTLLLLPVFMILAKPIIAYIGEGTIFEAYAVNSENNLGTPVFSAMVVLIAVVSTIFSRVFIETYSELGKFIIITLILSCFFMPSSWVDSNFIRIVFIPLIFIIALIPMLIDCLYYNNLLPFDRTFIYFIVGVGLLVLSY